MNLYHLSQYYGIDDDRNTRERNAQTGINSPPFWKIVGFIFFFESKVQLIALGDGVESRAVIFYVFVIKLWLLVAFLGAFH